MIEFFKNRRMPRKRKGRFEPPTFTPKPPEVITLSGSSSSESEDSCDDKIEIIEEPLAVIDILESSSSEDEDKDPNLEIINLSESILCNCKNFCIHSETLDYIPIPVSPENQPKRKKLRLNRKRTRMRTNNSEENDVEITSCTKPLKRKKLQTRVIKLSHPNTVNLGIVNKSGLRPIIIDGCNVAYGYGNGEFQARGIIVVVQYFLSRGHTEVICFLPACYRHKAKDPDVARIMVAYEKDQIVCYTPSRQFNGKSITPYDDRFIVQYASERDGVIITNDGYRDLIYEDKTWETTIEKRLINYTFARGMFMLPKDPLGANGPTLDEILRFPE